MADVAALLAAYDDQVRPSEARNLPAAARGVRFLQVDASDDSRPILERLGFVAITTTTPYVWTPG